MTLTALSPIILVSKRALTYGNLVDLKTASRGDAPPPFRANSDTDSGVHASSPCSTGIWP
jgi:hypothetical protein